MASYSQLDLQIKFYIFKVERICRAKASLDLSQAAIEKIVQDIDTDAYMDNYMLFTDKHFDHHVKLIDKLLTVLAEA